jgi:membrane protein implicated in regulation of membrane protease activity
MSTPGKIIFAVVLAYIALAASSLIGGFVVGMLGAALQLSPGVIRSLVWWLPKVIFAAMALLAFILWDKHQRANKTDHPPAPDTPPLP